MFKIHLYFTSYKDIFKIIKQKITSKKTLICTHTQRLKIKKLMKIISILITYQCKKSCCSSSVGQQK